MSDYLARIKDAVVSRKVKEIEGLIRSAVDSGLDPNNIINKALIEAMDVVGKDFAASKIYVPEMLVSAVTMKAGVNVLKPLLNEAGGHPKAKGRMLIVTVKGDLHDIGKNIVAMMVEGAGFEVIDLGINVDREKIVEAVRMHRPEILGLSALLTTTMPEIGAVIDTLARAGLREQVKVLVGGAAVTEAFARDVRADGYGRDAATAVELCRGILKQKASH